MVEITLTSTSPEADIIRQIEVLIRKMAVRQASSADVQLLHDLQRQRVNLMRPKQRQRATAA
jgi:hypothetical protein